MPSPAVDQILSAILREPADPMALAACLPLTGSAGDLRRSLKVLRWLAVIGLRAESVERQRSAHGRVLKTLDLRTAEAERDGEYQTVNVDGAGQVRISVTTEASRSFLALGGENGLEYEPGVTRYLVEAGRQGQVIADVGAHTGYYNTIAGAAGGIVIGFEMHPDLIPEIRRNIAINRLDKVHVINAAVGDHDGLIFNMRFDATPGQRVSDHIDEPPPDAFRQVLFDPLMCVRLDTAFGRNQVTPDLVKLDIEGYEIDALRGARGLIEGGITRFLVEFHPSLVGAFGHQPESLLTCFPETWTVEVLEDDGSLRPLGDDDRRLFENPPKINPKLLFSPPPA